MWLVASFNRFRYRNKCVLCFHKVCTLFPYSQSCKKSTGYLLGNNPENIRNVLILSDVRIPVFLCHFMRREMQPPANQTKAYNHGTTLML